MPKAEGILFCGGGTGGHVLPGLAVAASMRAGGERKVRWIGDPARIEATLVPSAGIDLLPYGLSRPRPRDPRWLWHAICTVASCAREIIQHPPRAVVALGGYAALVPGILAPFLRRPLVVMEQNAHAGRTNRLLAKGADAVVTQFAEAARLLPWRRVHDLGNPVRAIRSQPRGDTPRLRVLIMGGSLAARSLNDLLLGAAGNLAGRGDLHLVHLAGKDDAERCRATWLAAGAEVITDANTNSLGTCLSVEVHGFVSDMPTLYDRIDLVIGRSGATTVAELCVAGIGALYIPLQWAAEDHQTANAQAVARIGGAVVLPQATTTAAEVAGWLSLFARDRRRVADFGRRALQLARPQAAADVAALVNRCAHARGHRNSAARSQARQRFQHHLVRAKR